MTSIDPNHSSLRVWKRLTFVSTFIASVTSATLFYTFLTRRRRSECNKSPSIVPLQDQDTILYDGINPFTIPHPTPTPSPSTHRPWVCTHSLPPGASVRSACMDDVDAVYKLMRSASTVRDGLAREVDEMDHDYARDMIEPINDGGIVLVIEYDPSKVESTQSNNVSSSPSSSSSSSSPYLIGILKACRYSSSRCLRGSLNDVTIAVHASWHNKKLGQILFDSFFKQLATPEHNHILRVEMGCRARNQNALRMYLKVGFQLQSILHSRITARMPLDLNDDEKDDLPYSTEHDTDLVYFNPYFDPESLRKQLRMISKERRNNRLSVKP